MRQYIKPQTKVSHIASGELLAGSVNNYINAYTSNPALSKRNGFFNDADDKSDNSIWDN